MSKGLYKSLNYLEWDDQFLKEKPFELISYFPGISRDQTTNIKFSAKPAEYIEDVRGFESRFTLDDNGFTYVKDHCPALDFKDGKAIENAYLPQLEILLRTHMENVDRTFVFDYRVRDARVRPGAGEFFDLKDLAAPLLPSASVHVDQSPRSAIKRVHSIMGDEAEFLLRGRVQIVNVWRPIYHDVQDYPLAVCDGSKVQDDDLIAADHITRAYQGENLYVLYNENARWSYLSGQRPDEVLLFKIYDSDSTRNARCCPHTSFKIDDLPKDTMPRQSIEARVLVFTYQETVG